MCDTNDAQLLTLLELIFGKNASEDSDELIDDAAGSGIALIAALRARAASASTADKAIITAHFDRTKNEGITGELNLASLKAFLTKYKKRQARPACGQRPSADTEVEMIQQIAFKDRSLCELFELKKDSQGPQTSRRGGHHPQVDPHVEIARGRARPGHLRRAASHGRGQGRRELPRSSRSSPRSTPRSACGTRTSLSSPPARRARRARSGKDKDKDKDKDKVEIPRDADNRIIKWVDGMAPASAARTTSSATAPRTRPRTPTSSRASKA